MIASDMDIEHFAIIRENVERLLRKAAAEFVTHEALCLDVAPQNHRGAMPFLPVTVTVETIDIDASSDCTYIGDICKTNQFIESDRFDCIFLTEVLEHTEQPFAAMDEILRILKPGGILFLTTPFNFRIHGPLPDCWRFTEHGLKVLLGKFELIDLTEVSTPGRNLMPVCYAAIARRPVINSGCR